MITDVEKMDDIARRVCYRQRIRKKDMFLNTRFAPVVNARHHFYTLCKDEGFRVSEIQRYCERYGYPVEHATVIHGIKKVKAFEEALIKAGKQNLVRTKSIRERREEDKELLRLKLLEEHGGEV
jgi:chromosomal replication initiation ATPase DnaA